MMDEDKTDECWPWQASTMIAPRGNAGTHRVNEKMVAEEYRRGMRVRFIGRVSSNSLDFLIGGERGDG
jgi:hypothetical protein